MEDLFFESSFAAENKFHWNFVRDFKDKKKWIELAKQYDNFLNIDLDYNDKIPKIIHQIWIGPRPVPNKYKRWMKSWKSLNKSWEYKLWTNNDLKDINLINQKLFDDINNIGFKSDILRYEILYKYGGLYIDTDLECISKIPEKFCHYDFISCIVFKNTPQIANGAILAKPNSLLISKIINNISKPKDQTSSLDILKSSGADLVTKEYFQLKKEYKDKCLILPTNYFYPWPNFLISSNIEIMKFINEKTIGIHYWEVSWMKGNILKRIFLKIKFILKNLKIELLKFIK